MLGEGDTRFIIHKALTSQGINLNYRMILEALHIEVSQY